MVPFVHSGTCVRESIAARKNVATFLPNQETPDVATVKGPVL